MAPCCAKQRKQSQGSHQDAVTAEAMTKAAALAAAVEVAPTGLGRLTRGAAAALSRSAETIRAHVQSTLRCAA